MRHERIPGKRNRINHTAQPRRVAVVAAIVTFVWQHVGLQPAYAYAVTDTFASCAGRGSVVIVSGGELAPLAGVPVRQVSVFSNAEAELKPISFQIDRKDEKGRYILRDSSGDSENAAARLDSNDELVLLAAAAGPRASHLLAPPGVTRLTEIGLGGSGGPDRYVYLGVVEASRPPDTVPRVAYDAGNDAVIASAYRLGFDARLPFLIDSFQWRTSSASGWSPNMVDRMKIRHSGRFLKWLRFRRTEVDYSSNLMGVKAGPLRVIRRTENRIHMFWNLNSPTVRVDHLMTPDGLVMDTLIEMPFNVGLFFSDVETLTTLDWRSDPQLSPLRVQVPNGPAGLAVDGRMSREEEAFNRLQANELAVGGSLGRIFVRLDLSAGLPITPWLYLRDARELPDPPEHDVGQFGNVGFRTTGWERTERGLHHLTFSVCLEPASQTLPGGDAGAWPNFADSSP